MHLGAVCLLARVALFLHALGGLTVLRCQGWRGTDLGMYEALTDGLLRATQLHLTCGALTCESAEACMFFACFLA